MDAGWADWMGGAMEWVRHSGWLGCVGFVVLYVVSCVFFLPGSVLTVGAGAVFGTALGTLLVAISATAGATLNFVTSRYLARAWVLRKFGDHPRFHSLEESIGRRGWKLILISRLSPIFPHSLVSYSAGLSRMPLPQYILASLVGFIPLSAAYVYTGEVVGKMVAVRGPHNMDPTSWWVSFAGIVATVVVVVLSAHAAAVGLRAPIKPLDGVVPRPPDPGGGLEPVEEIGARPIAR